MLYAVWYSNKKIMLLYYTWYHMTLLEMVLYSLLQCNTSHEWWFFYLSVKFFVIVLQQHLNFPCGDQQRFILWAAQRSTNNIGLFSMKLCTNVHCSPLMNHVYDFYWNIVFAIAWIAMKLGSDIHVSLMVMTLAILRLSIKSHHLVKIIIYPMPSPSASATFCY